MRTTAKQKISSPMDASVISFQIPEIKEQKHFPKYPDLTKIFLSIFFIGLKRARKERFNF